MGLASGVRWVLGLGLAGFLGAQLGGCGQVVSIGPDAAVALANGDTCATGVECSSGHCTDSVCCDTACDGVCESCIVEKLKGSCSAVTAGEDPRLQCGPVAVNVPDGGTDDGGVMLNLPDGGVDVMNTKCAGTCDGKRACAYPGASMTCGASFCNNQTEVALSQCDGQGHCGIEPADCNGYVCDPNACKTSCTMDSECDVTTHFCNANGQCQAKNGLGVQCVTGSSCNSGFCSNNVCCNTDCAAILGGVCNGNGSGGQCQCKVNNLTCQTTCKAYYPDLDGDGFGDHNGAPIAGCGDTVPAANYVANNSDCYDALDASKPNAKHAFPGSTFSSTANRGDGSYDYDCDGVQTKVYVERPGATCGGCSAPISLKGGYVCLAPDTAVCTSNTASNSSRYMACDLAYNQISGSYNCVGQSFFLICQVNQTCYAYDQQGYNTIVACGAFGTYVECGACNGGGGVTSAENSSSRQQACH